MPSVGLENGTPSSRMGGDGQDVESTESNESSAGEADSLDSTRLTRDSTLSSRGASQRKEVDLITVPRYMYSNNSTTKIYKLK